MNAVYFRPPDCRSCYELGFMGDSTGCQTCRRLCKETVEVLSVGNGLMGSLATIVRKNGRIESVPMAYLVLNTRSDDSEATRKQ